MRTRPWRCYYCGWPFSNIKQITVDHVRPKCRGGDKVPNNLELACLDCNRAKGSMTEAQFRKTLLKKAK